MGCICGKSTKVDPQEQPSYPKKPHGNQVAPRPQHQEPSPPAKKRGVQRKEDVPAAQERFGGKVWSHVPVFPREKIRIEDTFWKEKKKLIPEYSHVVALDQHALSAPKQLVDRPHELVSYLTKVARTDLEKARVLIRWIGNNIAYDVDHLNHGAPSDNSIEGVLRNGRAVCAGYGRVFEHFCGLAGLQCTVIEGASKGGDYYPGHVNCMEGGNVITHAWNKVKVSGQWFLCDPTWAAGSVDTVQGKKTFAPRWKEEWFLTEPVSFLNSHLPLRSKEKDVLPEEQLVDHFDTDFNIWETRTYRTPMAYTLGVEPLSHKNGVIYTDDNEVYITFMYRHSMTFWDNFQCVTAGVESLNDCCMFYYWKNTVRVQVRLPTQGTYKFIINGAILYPDENFEKCNYKLLMYTIECRGNGTIDKLPAHANLCGVTCQFEDAGFSVIGYHGKDLHTLNGQAKLEIGLPATAVLPIIVNFHKMHKDEELKKCCYKETRENKLVLHMVCPEGGIYMLSIYVKYTEDGRHERAACFVVVCGDPYQGQLFPAHYTVWGPVEKFYELGMRISCPSSTLVCEDGKCMLKLHLTRPLQVIHSLLKDDTEYTDQGKCVFGEVNDSEIIYHIKVPKLGLYKLNIYAKEEDNEGSYSAAAAYFIDCRNACTEELYPEHTPKHLWGFTNHYKRLGLSSSHAKKSKLVVQNGQGHIDITMPSTVQIRAQITRHSVDKEQIKKCVVCTSTENKCRVHVTVPYTGYYHLQLLCLEAGQTNWNWLGHFLIENSNSNSYTWVPLEPHQLSYGIRPSFNSFGLTALECSDSMVMATRGCCKIKHTLKTSFNMWYVMVQQGADLAHYVYCERQGENIIYNVHLPHQGYYRLSGYGKRLDNDKAEELFSYLLYSDVDNPEVKPYFKYDKLWGLTSKAEALGVFQNTPSSTIVSDANYTAVLNVHFTKKMNTWCRLLMEGSPESESGKHVESVGEGPDKSFTVSLPEAARYRMNLYGQEDGKNVGDFLGTFLLLRKENI